MGVMNLKNGRIKKIQCELALILAMSPKIKQIRSVIRSF